MKPTMLAALYERPGGSDVLRVESVARPDPGPGDVRVRVSVCGVNPTDWKTRAGAGSALPADGFQIPGQDGAGVIDAVGPGVAESRIGERVWVYFAARRSRWGTAAQWTVLPAGQAVPLPEGTSFDLGAGLGIPALTAHRCLFADGALDQRATVLVAAGAGAVGHAAIELAHRAGARVVATASTADKARLATAAGADAVVLYRRDDAARQLRAAAPDGVDRVVEIDLAANLELDLAACRPHAAIATYADGHAPSLPLRPLMIANITLRFVLVYTLAPAALAAAVSDVSGALREGALSALPVTRFGLERTADAHDAVERGTVGKVLVDVP